MKNIKRSLSMLIAVLMMTVALTACGNKPTNEEATTSPSTKATEKATTAETVAETTPVDADTDTDADTDADTDTDDASTITEDDAIALVKEKMGAGYTYLSEGTVEENGTEYYSIRMMTSANGNTTTLDTFLVKTDGSAVLDSNGNPVSANENSSYVGEYYCSNETDVTMNILEDGTYELTTVYDDMKHVVSGVYSIGISASEDVVKMTITPKKSVEEANGETTVDDDMSDVEQGTVTIEGDKLTLVLEGAETVFTKK